MQQISVQIHTLETLYMVQVKKNGHKTTMCLNTKYSWDIICFQDMKSENAHNKAIRLWAARFLSEILSKVWNLNFNLIETLKPA